MTAFEVLTLDPELGCMNLGGPKLAKRHGRISPGQLDFDAFTLQGLG